MTASPPETAPLDFPVTDAPRPCPKTGACCGTCREKAHAATDRQPTDPEPTPEPPAPSA